MNLVEISFSALGNRAHLVVELIAVAAVNDIMVESCVGADQLKAIVDALSKVRFGVIQLTVHDGRVMQLDVTERHRFA